jgi:methionyl-tRNA synthetase
MSNQSTFYVTTAINYVNGAPHAGHGLEAVQADALARFHRIRGDETYFLTGTDDNSLTNVLAAEEEGLPIRDLVARNTEAFMALNRQLDISNDQFIRTSVDEKHRRGAQKLWRAVDAAGDIYTDTYSGLYCPRCELFYEEDELSDGLCPEHFIKPDRVSETNYFFRLSRYQEQLEALIAEDRYRVIPETRKNEVLSFIRSGLRDFSISRSLERARGWGIPVPDDPNQVMYVWFDALTNYITALGYADEDELYQRFWVNNSNTVHLIGKGITRFHAVYWPAMLLSARVPLPRTLFVHGYYTVEGRKMSKTLGNVVDPAALATQYGAEAVRYYFLAATSPTGDADFSTANFEARYNADLANDLGNLLNRTISMIRRYRDGVIPARDPSQSANRQAADLERQVSEAMDSFDFQAAMTAIWEVVGHLNRRVEVTAPWMLAKQEKETGDTTPLDEVLHELASGMAIISRLLRPLMPATADAIRGQLGTEADWAAGDVAGVSVGEPVPLFPRLDR